MVKFSKQLESQLVPEWKSAFCDYWKLKKDLDQVKSSQLMQYQPTNLRSTSFKPVNLQNITRRRSSVPQDILLVHLRSAENQHEDYYETELLEPMALGETEKTFFRHLDEQLNKVNKFFKQKEAEYFQREEEIKDQLSKLMALKECLKHQQSDGTDSNADEINQAGCSQQSSEDSNSVSSIKFNIPRTTPMLTVGGLIQTLMEDLPIQTKNEQELVSHSKVEKKKIQYAEKMLRTAFVEFYRGLGLLRTFSYLNTVAFTKIMKKYDKITGKEASSSYMKVVERAYFHSSEKVLKMMDDVEKIFTECFSKGDRKLGMSSLRQTKQRSSHTVTFFLGFFIGCSSACLAAFIILVHLSWFAAESSDYDDAKKIYMASVFPIFSILSMIVLHIYMYGLNLLIWREKRINYAFIFEFSINTELKHREVLLVASGLTTLIVGGLLGHFMAYTHFSSANNALIPLAIILVFVLLLFCPFDICYRSSRKFLLTRIKHIILAPLYKVVMADFFLADQLTSQVYMFRNVEYVLCYYITGHKRVRGYDVCTSDNITFQALSYLVSLLPYWWRLVQCLRRLVDEGQNIHIINSGKYFSAMVAAAVSLTYKYKKGTGWAVGFVICSTMATGYQLYWDFIVDWGLLKLDSKNFLLRDRLMYRDKRIYFISMVINVVLRLAWLQSLTHFDIFKTDRRVQDLFFASLEVIRRGHWNIYRLENEHLNNVGNFRAIKTVPLPFQAVENDA